MATLAELHALYLRSDAPSQDLFKKVVAAVFKVAETVRVEADTTANHANRVIWARQAFTHPEDKASQMWVALLAANAGASQAAILAASDAAIETAVAAAVNIFASS